MTEVNDRIRVIDIDFLGGAQQLALTEAMISAVGKGLAPPTLRLYSWSEPVVIIGVGQPISDLDLEVCRQRGFRVLRRIAGGTAVYHDADEVSVDFILPAGHRLAPSDVHDGYRAFSGLLNRALESVGVESSAVSVEQARGMRPDGLMRPICFAAISPYEFFSSEHKLNGLCQIRRRESIAYQAAIYNRFKGEPLIAALRHDSPEVRDRRAERLDTFVTDMESVRGEPVEYRRLQKALVDAAETEYRLTPVFGELTDWELTETDRLVTEKYGNQEWTERR